MSYRVSYAGIEIGQRFAGPGRTLSETDLTLYSMIMGDWHPIHADAEFAQNTQIGQRIFHGSFGIGLALGMAANLVEFDEPVIALLDVRDWVFREPMLIGQTLHVETTVLEKRVTSDGLRAIVDRTIALVTRDSVVQEGKSRLMLALTAPASVGS